MRSSPRDAASGFYFLGAQEGKAAAAGGTDGGEPLSPCCPLCQVSARHAVPPTGTRLLFSESAKASLISAQLPGSLGSPLGPVKADCAFRTQHGSRLLPGKRLPLAAGAQVIPRV